MLLDVDIDNFGKLIIFFFIIILRDLCFDIDQDYFDKMNKNSSNYNYRL